MKNNFPGTYNLTEEEAQEIAKRILYLRSEVLHMTQSDFAAALKIGQSYLSQLESGKKTVNKALLESIALAFSVNIDWLLRGSHALSMFVSEDVTKELYSEIAKKDAMKSIQKVFSLKPDEYDAVQLLLNLPPKERQKCLNAFLVIQDVFASCTTESD